MSAKLLKGAYVADDVITLNEFSMRKMQFLCKNCCCSEIMAVLSPNNRFLQSVSTLCSILGKRTGKFSMFLHLHEARDIREYRQLFSIDAYENIGILLSFVKKVMF